MWPTMEDAGDISSSDPEDFIETGSSFDLEPEELDLDDLLSERLALSPLPVFEESPLIKSGEAGGMEGPPCIAPSQKKMCTRSQSFSGLNTIYEHQEAVLYSFEDYVPSLESTEEPQSQLYSFCLPGDNKYKKMPRRSSGQGKEFVRSRTLPVIPVQHYLSQREIHREYNKPAVVCTTTGTALCLDRGDISSFVDEDLLLPGQVSHRSHSAERRSRSRSRYKRPGTSWILGDDDVLTEGVPSPDGRSSPSPTAAQLYYTTPPKSQMTSTLTPGDGRSRLERSHSAKGGLSRLARRLSHKESRRNTEERKKALRQRSVSLDCGDGRRSLMSANQLEVEKQDEQSLSIPASPSLPTKLGRSSGSSSPNLAHRLSRKASSNKSRKGTEGADSSKERRRKNIYDVQALLEAVEHQDIDLVKEILDTCCLDINYVNEADMTALDIALLCNHVPMAKMLLHYGARENPRYQDLKVSRLQQLTSLVDGAESRVSGLSSQIINGGCGSGGTSSTQLKENEKLLNQLEFQYKLLKRMRTGFEHAKPPEPPTNVRLSVASSSSLYVQFEEPLHHNGAVVTRYKVEWSCFEDFNPLAGEQIIDDPHYTFYEIPSLTQGNVYYCRVKAWNIKGFGPHAVSSPACAVPSNWREVDNMVPRSEGKLELLDNLFTNLKNSRPANASEIKASHTPGSSPLHPRRSTVRKSIKNLFASAPKFQKTLKRGVYLACLLYSEDRILVTNEDNLPIIEVDETFSGTTLNSDFHWFMKVACTWEDVKSLKQDMERCTSTSLVHLRSKLLQAANQLQSGLGIQDLGKFYYAPTRDPNGSVVLTTVACVRDPKAVNTAHTKWIGMNKVQRKVSSSDQLSAPEQLLSSTNEMIRYHRASREHLPRGLYLGYLKLKSSVDQIRIVVPELRPNILPFERVRDNPNVCKEEWQWLQSLSLNEIHEPATAVQQTFQTDLKSASHRLLQSLGVTDDESVSHRLYDLEVIELTDDITMILLLPPVESVCSIPGHPEEMSERPNYITLPVQTFEMIHMCTYQYDFISRYSRLSSILEMDTQLAQQAQREAFSSEELADAKNHVDQLAEFQQQLDDAWKAMRWTMDIITYARDKNVRGGLPLSIMYAPPPSPTESPTISRKDLDIVVSSSNSDAASSSCSDCGYHSDRSSVDITMEAQSTCKDRGSVSEPACGCHGSTTEDTEDVWTKVVTQPGILRVYAAYDTGLARGTSVKLHVTPRTSSREVINLVVQQLNKAAAGHGIKSQSYSDEELQEFCLVAVIGARERVLRDDYQPLQLQNPWTKGRLYVRLRSNLLAALEQGQVTSV